MNSRQRNILHLDLDAFFVAVERVVEPRLKGRPVVVGGPPEARGVVASASYEARAFGIHSAMPMARALRLCPEVIRLPGQHDLYARASKAVMKILGAYSPLVESVGLDEGYLDLTGTNRLFGAAVDAAARLQREVKERLRLEATIGISGSKLVSKVGSAFAKPRGLVDVMRGQEGGFLDPLKVTRLPGVGSVTAKRMRDFNIHRVSDLTAVDLNHLVLAFGGLGRLLFRRARGMDDSPVLPRRGVKSIGCEETFPIDTADYAELSRKLFGQAESACQRIRRQGLMARTVQVAIRYADFVEVSRAVTLGTQTDMELEIYPAAEALLRKLHSRRTLVRRLGLRLSNLAPGSWQLSLLPEARSRDRQRALIDSLDKIRERLGQGVLRWGRNFTPLTDGAGAGFDAGHSS